MNVRRRARRESAEGFLMRRWEYRKLGLSGDQDLRLLLQQA